MEDMGVTPDRDFWCGKRVLITGHTGFKGSWLSIWLSRLRCTVMGIALPPEEFPNLFTLAEVQKLVTKSCFVDVRDRSFLKEAIEDFSPQIVFHLAAQSLVRRGYKNPHYTFETNILGTINLLEIARNIESIKVIIVVTTDKVYENKEWFYPYRETDQLGGKDPYSASKAAVEIVTESYRRSFFKNKGVAVASARSGNVIGGGDWAEDRLIPDMIKAWEKDETLLVRNPYSVRPWQHVLEPLWGYMLLAEKLWHEPELAGAYNFGPFPNGFVTVREMIELAKTFYGSGKVIYSGEVNNEFHEASLLRLDISKSQTLLGFIPRWSLLKSIEKTINWYRSQKLGMNPVELCLEDIRDYERSQSQ